MNLVLLLVFAIIGIPVIIGLIFLQIILSKNSNRILGLILPIISFIFALIIVIGFYNFSIQTRNYSTIRTVGSSNGIMDSEVVSVPSNVHKSYGFSLLFMLLIFNIPTIIYLCIYFAYRKKGIGGKEKELYELNKMNIQDLE